jgi:ribA/ribD-fused uncharacterized protein
MINKFRGANRFLSNFYETSVEWEGLTYPSSEAAFQASKTLDQEDRKRFQTMAPTVAKREGYKVKLRENWEDIKIDVMYQIVLAKFSQNEFLKQKLIATGREWLEEGNTWGDRTWGTVDGIGNNYLGKVLMTVRSVLMLQEAIDNGEIDPNNFDKDKWNEEHCGIR